MVEDELPASERFFAGGDTTVRGFPLDSLGTPETLDKISVGAQLHFTRALVRNTVERLALANTRVAR